MADDGEGFDSWEEQEDSGMLDKRIGELQIDTHLISEDKGDSNNVMLKELTNRTEYTPQVRILKREQNPTSKPVEDQNASQTSKPSKTLEEREAEYAEARQRIFGDEPQPLEMEGDIRPIRLICKVEEPLANNVLRQPRGPDGTLGFNIER